MRAGPGAVLLTLALGVSSALAQPLPDLTLDAYPPVSREPIARALANARARPQDAAATGHLAMLLHAWEQWESAATVSRGRVSSIPASSGVISEASSRHAWRTTPTPHRSSRRASRSDRVPSCAAQAR